MSSGAEIHPATLWERIAEIADDRPAIIQADVSRSWREFDDRAARLAGVLWDAGLRPGSRVGIYLPNALEYLEAWYAAFKIRCIPVNINYRYVADELAYLLDDSGSEALVFPSSLSGHVAEVLADRDVKAVLQVAGDGDHLIEGATRFDEAVASAEPKDTMEREEQDHYIVYTGGTTGLPKGVVYEIGPLLAELAAIIGPFTGSGEVSGAGDVVDNARNAIEAGTSLTGMILPPLMHGTGIALALGALITGGTVVLSAEGSFEPGAALDAVENTGATFLVVVGDAFMRPLLEELEARRERGHPADLSTVTLVMSSGAMLSEASKSSFLEHAPQAILVDQLAASEGAMGSSITTAGGGPGTAAFSLRPGTRVLDENDVDVEPGSRSVRPRGRAHRQSHRVLQRPGEDRGHLPNSRRREVLVPRRPCRRRSRWHDQAAGSWQQLHQHRRGEGLPRGGRRGSQSPLERHGCARVRGRRRQVGTADRSGGLEPGRVWRSHRRGPPGPRQTVARRVQGPEEHRLRRHGSPRPQRQGGLPGRASACRSRSAMTMTAAPRREELRREREPVKKYRGRFEIRVVVTFLAFSVAWVGVIALGVAEVIPLWAGLIANTVIASTFYMPMHEAVHGNISGDRKGLGWVDDVIGSQARFRSS